MTVEGFDILEDLSMPVSSAYVGLLVVATPALILLCALYSAIWGLSDLLEGVLQLLNRPAIVLGTIVLGVVLHEILHLVPWILFAGLRLADVKLGFQAETLTPYAHVKLPIHKRPYQLGTFFPGLIMGLIPFGLGLILGEAAVALLGLFFIYAAAGDFLVLWRIRGVEADALLLDHPTRVGCYVLADKGGTSE